MAATDPRARPAYLRELAGFAAGTRGFGMPRYPCVYMLASRRNGTLYLGVTSHPIKRVWQHKNDLVESFTKRYGVHSLVWFESHATMDAAIAREKAIKRWKRAWKLRLVEASNPEWRDLYDDLV